ncbi:MAG: HD domain-containing phosphohydrolase [Terracidiphilus sp.]|jgi:response regulator RpfG family c-di-GMP phosphodiesterase
MTDRILFVDDEPAVLDGYKRTFHREFEVDTAEGGEMGLASIRDRGPYSVVISDMRMPGMNGAQFLAQVRQRTPDTVRMLLTGYTDLDAAIEAVNEGNIFRFLTKPCDKEVLTKAITAGLVQYRLVTAEKELLEKTVMGSIKVLTDVLSAASPETFGRSRRIAHYVRHLVLKFRLTSIWRFEAAATLSQLGCLTLNSELIQQAYTDTKMSPEDQARFNAHPQAGMDLLAHIPRLEAVAWMISQQLTKDIPAVVPGMPEDAAKEIVLGAKILKLALAFDDLRMKRMTVQDAIGRLHTRRSEFEKELIDGLEDIVPPVARMALRKISTLKLAVGMVVEQEIRTKEGMLLVAKAQEITPALLLKLDNRAKAGQLDKEIMALVPV